MIVHGDGREEGGLLVVEGVALEHAQQRGYVVGSVRNVRVRRRPVVRRILLRLLSHAVSAVASVVGWMEKNHPGRAAVAVDRVGFMLFCWSLSRKFQCPGGL